MPSNSSPSQDSLSDSRKDADSHVQTGALSGGQPGTGVNTSASRSGQSNADAAQRQGTEYGKDNLKQP